MSQATATVRHMAKVVKRTYRYRFYPSPEQTAELSRTFGCVRLVWNKALEMRSEAWCESHERISYVQSSAMLTQWKASNDLAFLNEVSSVPLQQALRHLQSAFVAFWNNRARFPRCKSRKRSRQSAEYTRSAFRWRCGQLILAKMNAPLDIAWSRPLPDDAQPSTVTVSRDAAGRWFVSILVEEAIESLPPAATIVGSMRASRRSLPCRRARRWPIRGTSAATEHGWQWRSAATTASPAPSPTQPGMNYGACLSTSATGTAAS